MSKKHSKKRHDKRFEITAIDKGFITPDELLEAPKAQVQEDIEYGNRRLIGYLVGSGPHDHRTSRGIT